jgi:hypothetical protein
VSQGCRSDVAVLDGHPLTCIVEIMLQVGPFYLTAAFDCGPYVRLKESTASWCARSLGLTPARVSHLLTT